MIDFLSTDLDGTATYSMNQNIMGNSGDVGQGRCGGGAPYCCPRGARFNLLLNPLS